MSRLDLIVGPNGAGKTTLFERVIFPGRPGLSFVNADDIAAARFGDAATQMSYVAADIAANTRAALIEARLDFCTETVFSHPSKVDLIDAAATAGYDVVLHVVMVPIELSALRVAARVAAGGHNVPTDKISERYARIWPNVVAAVSRCRRSVFYDNSDDAGPIEVAAFRTGLSDYPPRWPNWSPDDLLTAFS